MKKPRIDYIAAVIGILLLGIGLYFVKMIVEPQGFLKALPYVCVGLGCGIFGHGMGSIISRKAVASDPNAARQHEIEKNDERNIFIASRSKAKAYDIMVFVFGALMITFALMGIDMAAVLLLVFAYLFVVGCGIFYRCKFEKEM